MDEGYEVSYFVDVCFTLRSGGLDHSQVFGMFGYLGIWRAVAEFV